MKAFVWLVGIFIATAVEAKACSYVTVNSCADMRNYDWENQYLIEDVLGCKFICQDKFN